MPKQLLIIAHAPSPNTQHMVDAVMRGANSDEIGSVAARHLNPLDAKPEDVFNADAIILGTTENSRVYEWLVKRFF